jgi:UDP-N-acetylmuramoylalanine--D-glutamate ligase
MLKELLNYLENKNIVILGFGMEGESSYRFLRKSFPEKQLFIVDKNINLLEGKTELMEDPFLEVSLGENYLLGIEQYDLILKAPGISLKDIDISNFENKITSQLELFLEFFDICTIGITGTKGKSTTSSLIYKILEDQQKQAFLLGNIGEPIFNDIENMDENSIAVIELSSHALEFVKKSTRIGIILDIYEEHLDHYKSLEKYIEAKYNIAKYQNNNDFLIYNFDNDFMNNYNFKYKENDFAVSTKKVPEVKNKVFLKDNFIYCNNEKCMNIDEEMNLKGMYNINNIMFIFAVCCILNLNIEKSIKSIKEFKPLEHRLEFVANVNGVEYYNNSIATIPESTIEAIKALKNVNTVIVGGKDRGVNQIEFIEYLKNCEVENIICLPKTGEYIYEGLEGSNKNIYFTSELEDAVKIAKKVTKKDFTCLLSPAASSYGYFKNFEERGKLFKKYVMSPN